MKRAAGIVVALLIVIAAALPLHPQIPSGRDVVSANAYPSLEPIPQGHSFQIAVVMKIRTGFHVNARQPSADYLIPTDLRVNLPPGLTGGEVSYPKGVLQKFAFSKTPLNVYEDKIILRVPLTAEPDAPLGPQHIPFKLRFQACSNEVCLPPVTIDVDASILVVQHAEHFRPIHPELFPAP